MGVRNIQRLTTPVPDPGFARQRGDGSGAEPPAGASGRWGQEAKLKAFRSIFIQKWPKVNDLD